MTRPKPRWIREGLVVFVTLCLALGWYWGRLLQQSMAEQYGDDPEQFIGFLRWLMGYALVALGLAGVAWLNFRWPYQLVKRKARWYYHAWLLALYAVFVELLQWRSGREPELVDENMLVAILLTTGVAGLTLVYDMAQSRRERAELLQQKTAAELNNLRAQLNPHFLFNALNTVYSEAIRQGQDKLSQHIAELSGILRFALQHSQSEVVSLSEEVQFLRRYINLQQARLPHNPQRQFAIYIPNYADHGSRIAPFLLLPFIENAFLYGLHPSEPCFISVQLQLLNNQLCFKVSNSIIRPQTHRGAGLGIANVRQRLERLYPHRHQLDISARGDTFFVELCLKGVC